MSGMFDCWWKLFRGPQIVSTPELEPYQLESILLSMMGDGLFGSWLMARLVSDPILEYKDEKNRLKGSRRVNILHGFETTSAGAPPAARVCL